MAAPAPTPTTRPPKDDPKITIRTILPKCPLPASSTRLAFHTERLTIRPMAQDDLKEFNILRTQPEVMINTALGKVDADLAATQAKLDLFIPPNDAKTVECAICWRETGELIGSGGVHNFVGMDGWPEMGYMFRKEYWGKGLGTEFAQAFLKYYCTLPRARVELEVAKTTLIGLEPIKSGEKPEYEEQLYALVESGNTGSVKIVRKNGFEQYGMWQDVDHRDKTKMVDLLNHRWFPGRNGAPAPE